MATCAKCKHWREECPADDVGGGDALGACGAVESLPFAFRYAWREVVWTRADEPPADKPCSFHNLKD